MLVETLRVTEILMIVEEILSSKVASHLVLQEIQMLAS